MFSGALQRVLGTGDPTFQEFLSLEEVAGLVEKDIFNTFRGEAVRPELHTPKQEQGDIRTLRFFPNPARRKEIETRAQRELRTQVEELAHTVADLVKELKETRAPVLNQAGTPRTVTRETPNTSAKKVEGFFFRPRNALTIFLDSVGFRDSDHDRPVWDRLSISGEVWDQLLLQVKQWVRIYYSANRNSITLLLITALIVFLNFLPALVSVPSADTPRSGMSRLDPDLRATNIISLLSIMINLVFCLSLFLSFFYNQTLSSEIVPPELLEDNEILDKIVSQKIIHVFGVPSLPRLSAICLVSEIIGFLALTLMMLADPDRWSIARFFLLGLPPF
jgi:hypothetical protein